MGLAFGLELSLGLGLGFGLEVRVDRAAAKRFCCAKPETRAPSCNHMCATLQP